MLTETTGLLQTAVLILQDQYKPSPEAVSIAKGTSSFAGKFGRPVMPDFAARANELRRCPATEVPSDIWPLCTVTRVIFVSLKLFGLGFPRLDDGLFPWSWPDRRRVPWLKVCIGNLSSPDAWILKRLNS